MLLNYKLRISNNQNKIIPIIMLHGLFGNLSNLNTLSTSLLKYFDIIQIDLRNHGQSPHHPIMTYTAMAQDIINLLNYLLINKCIVIGHSMGGKVAMTLGILAENRIEKIIIIDIAPKKYNTCTYQNILSVINYVNSAKITNKNDIFNFMQQYHIKPNIILFLLKSYQKGKWNFNFDVIKKNKDKINDWAMHQICWKTCLFIKGALSSYIKDSYIYNIYHQFPLSHIHTVPNATHWVHYDNPKYVYNIIKNFIFNNT